MTSFSEKRSQKSRILTRLFRSGVQYSYLIFAFFNRTANAAQCAGKKKKNENEEKCGTIRKGWPNWAWCLLVATRGQWPLACCLLIEKCALWYISAPQNPEAAAQLATELTAKSAEKPAAQLSTKLSEGSRGSSSTGEHGKTASRISSALS